MQTCVCSPASVTRFFIRLIRKEKQSPEVVREKSRAFAALSGGSIQPAAPCQTKGEIVMTDNSGKAIQKRVLGFLPAYLRHPPRIPYRKGSANIQ